MMRYWSLMQTAVPKGRGVSGSFYKNVVLKKLRTKMRKICPEAGLHHVYFLYDNVSAQKSSTLAQFLKSEKVNVLSHLPYSPDLAPCDFSSFRTENTPIW